MKKLICRVSHGVKSTGATMRTLNGVLPYMTPTFREMRVHCDILHQNAKVANIVLQEQVIKVKEKKMPMSKISWKICNHHISNRRGAITTMSICVHTRRGIYFHHQKHLAVRIIRIAEVHFKCWKSLCQRTLSI